MATKGGHGGMATKGGNEGGRKSKSGKKVVAAIDFGTTFSGYAFSFNHDYETDPTKVATNKSWVAGYRLVSLKTPTILLLDNKKQFLAFGYEAEERYSDIAAEDEHNNYYYYRRFKMLLHKVSGDHLTRDVMIPDDKGRLMPALQVFSISINYLRKHLMETLNKRMTDIEPGDIRWVLTVPAIWNDRAKQFMREAAEKAGIAKESLIIALEPEAASLFCMNLLVDKIHGGSETEIQKISMFTKGTRYMILDVGGGTVDITMHEVVGDGELKELNYASGGAWGGTRVDAAFEKFLRSIVDTDTRKDKSVFEKFMQEAKEDWIQLLREFESKKREINGFDDKKSKRTIRFPLSLAEIFKDVTGKNLKDFIKTKEEYADRVSLAGDKLRVEVGLFRSWFDESCKSTVKHVKEIFKQESSKNTDTIVLVGGVSDSPLLQDAIRANFPDKRIFIPEEAGLAVLKGAVIFGHNPVAISRKA